MEESLPAVLRNEDGSPGPDYQAYVRYRQAYQTSLDAYHAAYAAAQQNPAQLQQWPMQGKALQDKVNAALQDWQALGRKAEVEQALKG